LKYFPNSEWITVIKKICILRRHVSRQLLKKAKVKQWSTKITMPNNNIN